MLYFNVNFEHISHFFCLDWAGYTVILLSFASSSIATHHICYSVLENLPYAVADPGDGPGGLVAPLKLNI